MVFNILWSSKKSSFHLEIRNIFLWLCDIGQGNSIIVSVLQSAVFMGSCEGSCCLLVFNVQDQCLIRQEDFIMRRQQNV